MTDKSKGRPLPPLLPLEYCTISRAAKMLDCEAEDLFHWAEIAAIKLWVKLDNENCGVLFLLEHDFKHLQKLAIIQNAKNVFDDTLLVTAGLSMLSVDPEDLADHVFLDGEPLTLEVGIACGLWTVEFSDIIKHSNKTEGYFTPSVFYSDKVDNGYFILDLDSEMRFRLDELLIVRGDLEKIHNSITMGETLVNRLNDAEVAGEVQNKDRHLQRTVENNSPKKALALMSLSEYVIKTANLDAELINRPDALTTAINKELVKLKIPEIDGAKTLYTAFQLAITHREKM